MYFNSLQTLRGFFAILIFYNHLYPTPDLFGAGGICGVGFFFVLSGFVLCHGYSARLKRDGTEEPLHIFLIRRFSKIYPLHILCLAVVVFSQQSFPSTVISDILLFQAWIPSQHWIFSGNGVSWCLSDFLFFYLLFPYLFRKMTGSPRTFVSVYLAALSVYAFAILPVLPERYIFAITYINPLPRLFDFVFGMLLWRYLSTLKHVDFSRRAGLQLICVILLAIVSVTAYATGIVPDQYKLSLLWWPLSAALIVFAVKGPGARLLDIKPLVWFGNISFSFYLIHRLSQLYLDRFFQLSGVSLPPAAIPVVYLALTILFAALINRYFVMPVERAIRKKFLTRA